jgi:hypothetical protein
MTCLQNISFMLLIRFRYSLDTMESGSMISSRSHKVLIVACQVSLKCRMKLAGKEVLSPLVFQKEASVNLISMTDKKVTGQKKEYLQ